MAHHKITRSAAASAAAAFAALAVALPATAKTAPEPEPNPGTIPSVILATPASAPDTGIQVYQVGAGLLAGAGIGAAPVAAGRNRRQAHMPGTALAQDGRPHAAARQ